jgi:hypothetical protein
MKGQGFGPLKKSIWALAGSQCTQIECVVGIPRVDSFFCFSLEKSCRENKWSIRILLDISLCNVC